MTLALRMLLRIKTKKWDAGASQDPLVAKLMRDEWNGDQLYLPHTRRCSLFQWRYGGMEDGEPEPKCTCGTTSLAQSRLLEFFLLRLKCRATQIRQLFQERQLLKSLLRGLVGSERKRILWGFRQRYLAPYERLWWMNPEGAPPLEIRRQAFLQSSTEQADDSTEHQ
uniref:Uncharacterized protein n=1 Tax=Myoviridae sp. cteBs22 TaxID=2826675 RepID=A0A8S5R1I2_9CAUD|nr:MAG TPA: hypothetical protein [Myoviridae sp. cteBs22]